MKYEVLQNWGEEEIVRAKTTEKGAMDLKNLLEEILNHEEIPKNYKREDTIDSSTVRYQDQEDLELVPEDGPHLVILLPTSESKMKNYIVKLQSSLTVQSKSVGLGVDFVFPPSQLTNN